MRLQVCLVRHFGAPEEVIGAAFIPLKDIGETESKSLVAYKIVNYRHTASDIDLAGAILLVKTVKRVEEDECKGRLTLCHSLVSADEHNSSYVAEGVLAGSIDSAQLFETFSVTATFSGLEITLPPLPPQEREPQRTESTASATSATSAASSAASRGSDVGPSKAAATAAAAAAVIAPPLAGKIDPDEIVVEVFENQRRMPVKGWSSAHLMMHPRFADASGYNDMQYESLSSAPPPQGFEWIADQGWSLDRQYTKQDGEGWSYALSYDFLVLNAKNHHSVARPSLVQVLFV